MRESVEIRRGSENLKKIEKLPEDQKEFGKIRMKPGEYETISQKPKELKEKKKRKGLRKPRIGRTPKLQKFKAPKKSKECGN